MSRDSPTDDWTIDITPGRALMSIPIAEIFKYRDLLCLFVRRDFVSFYKQTIFGPLWFVIQPVLTALMFTLVFGRIAGLSSDGAPQLLFYLSGVTMWTFFADCFTKTAGTFTDNAQLFGKVYFPRLITPLSVIVSNLLKFTVQLVLFLAVWSYFLLKGAVHLQWTAFLLPFLLVILALTSLGFGLIFSALTAKYRDLRFLLQFGVQLFMYLTPVIYPLSSIPERYAVFISANPVAPIIEAFRHGYLGVGSLSWIGLAYSFGFSVVILFLGVVAFNRVEGSFIDTV